MYNMHTLKKSNLFLQFLYTDSIREFEDPETSSIINRAALKQVAVIFEVKSLQEYIDKKQEEMPTAHKSFRETAMVS